MHDRGDVRETSKPSGFSFQGVYSARRSSRVPRRTSSSFSDGAVFDVNSVFVRHDARVPELEPQPRGPRRVGFIHPSL